MKKTLLFAAGLLLSAGSLWAEVPEGIVVTPTPGTVTEEISEIEINVKGLFPEGSYGIYYATVTYNSLSITSNNGYKAENVPLEVVNQTEGTVKVTLENPISGTENGTYTVTTNFESFKYYGESNAQTPVPNFEFNYVVGTGEGGGSGDDPDNPGDDTVEYMDPPAGYKITNTAGVGLPGEVEQISGFFDLYLNEVYSSVTGFNDKLKAFVINAKGEKVGNTDGYGVNEYLTSSDVDVAFSVNPSITEPGEYYLVFPFAGCKATPKDGGDEITMKDMKIGPYIIKGDDPGNDPGDETTYIDMPEGTVFYMINGLTSITSNDGTFESLKGILNPEFPDYKSVSFPGGSVVQLMKDGAIVSGVTYTLTDNGVDGMYKDVQWDVKPEITEDGTYYFILPTKGLTNGATTIEGDMKVGPFVIETKVVEYEAARVSYIPAYDATVMSNDLPKQIVVNVNNAAKLKVTGLGDNIAMTRPDNSAVAFGASMYYAVAGENTFTYLLPEGWYTVPGEYTVTLSNPSAVFSGETEEGKVLTFPNSNYSWKFTVEEPAVFPTESLVPAGLVVAPEAGEYESVETVDLTFNATCLPNFYAFFAMTKEATVWNKATDEKTIVKPGEPTNSNKTIPYTLNLTEEGEYAVIFDFKDAVYVSTGTSGMDMNTPFPEGMQKVVLLYTIKAAAEAPEIPDVVIGSEAVSEDTYEIEEGKSVTVTLAGGEGVDVYYKWTAAKADTPATGIEETTDWTLYTEPLEIDGAGDLSYYAEKDGVKSEEKTLSFTVKEAEVGTLPAEIASIVPAPGTYKVWDYETITFNISGYGMAGTTMPTATVTNPDGDTKSDFEWKMVSSKEWNFATGDFFDKSGTYTVEVDFSKLMYANDDFEASDGPKFSFKYVLDTETGVAYIEVDGEEAEYYDLNGRRLKGELVPGIYVKNVNGKVSKVIVK